jgi:hypothetical protein
MEDRAAITRGLSSSDSFRKCSWCIGKGKKTRERKSMKETENETAVIENKYYLLLLSKEKLGWGGRCAEIL